MALSAAAGDRFTLGVGPWTGTVPTQELGQFSEVSLVFNADGGADLTLSLPGTSPAAQQIDELATDVWVYLDEAEYARLRVVAVEQVWEPNGADYVTVVAVDYKRLLNARHFQSALSYSATPQADVVWSVIQHAQAQPGGNLGITAGTLNSGGYVRDRNWSAGENIGKELTDLSGVLNGPYWTIDANLALQVTLYDVFPVRDTPIALGGTARSLQRLSGASSFANSVWVDGDGDFTVPVSADAADVASDPRGRWERAAGFPNVKLQASLTEKANGLLVDARTPPATWMCSIEPSRFLLDANFAVNEYVEVVVPKSVVAPIGSPAFSNGGQVVNVALTLNGDGLTSVEMSLVEVS